MMNYKRLFVLLVVFSLLSWACSSSKKPETAVAGPFVVTSASQEPAETPPPPQIDPLPAAQEAPVSPAENPVAGQERPDEDLAAEQEPPSVLLDEALNLYQEAVSEWEKGDNDAALRSLDEAYALMLKVRLQPDSPLVQEKERPPPPHRPARPTDLLLPAGDRRG